MNRTGPGWLAVRRQHMAQTVLMAAVMLLATGPGLHAEIVLANEARTAHVIVLRDTPTAAERHAAAELAQFLGAVTGARFPIVAESATEGRPRLVVGAGATARSIVGTRLLDELGPEEFVIVSHGNDIVLAGGRPRGTLYAVYAFLETVVGCRWWTADAMHVPQRPTLTVPPLEVRDAPRFAYREPYFPAAVDADWAARNRVNGTLSRLDEQRGGRVRFAEGFVHTFHQLVPPAEHFAPHPNWYSERDGQRFWEGGQLCLTNPELMAHLSRRVLDTLRADPGVDIVCVSQNDWGGRCQCADCLALEALEGSPAGPILHAVNAVADAVAREFPQVAVSTLAYQYSRRPPRQVRPRDNVIVRLCAIECSHVHPYASAVNQDFAEDLANWSRIGKRLHVWDYVIDFRHYPRPFPNLHVLGPNLRLFADTGVEGVFAQGYGEERGGELAELRAWVMAKLLWNPDQDAQALIREFAEGYYGAAAPAILGTIDLCRRAIERHSIRLGFEYRTRQTYLAFDDLADAKRLFAEALRLTRDKPELRRRAQIAHAPFRAVWAVRWNELRQTADERGAPWPGPPDYRANARAVQDMVAAERWNSHATQRFLARLAEEARRDAMPPPGCETLGGWQFRDFPASGFRLAPAVATRDDDPLRAGAAAVLVRARHRHRENAVLAGMLLIGTTIGALTTRRRDGYRIALWLIPASLVSGILALWPLGPILSLALAGRWFHPTLAPAAGRGLGLAAGLLVAGCLIALHACSRRGRATSAHPGGARHWRALALGALAGALVAVLALAALYNLGGAVDAAKGELAWPPGTPHAPSSSGRGSRTLPRIHRALHRSWAGCLLRQTSPLNPRHHEHAWAVAQHLFPHFEGDAARYRCYAVIRTGKSARKPMRIHAGVYDEQARRELGPGVVATQQATSGAFEFIDFGEHRLSNTMRLWLAAPETGTFRVERMVAVTADAAPHWLTAAPH